MERFLYRCDDLSLSDRNEVAEKVVEPFDYFANLLFLASFFSNGARIEKRKKRTNLSNITIFSYLLDNKQKSSLFVSRWNLENSSLEVMLRKEREMERFLYNCDDLSLADLELTWRKKL